MQFRELLRFGFLFSSTSSIVCCGWNATAAAASKKQKEIRSLGGMSLGLFHLYILRQREPFMAV